MPACRLGDEPCALRLYDVGAVSDFNANDFIAHVVLSTQVRSDLVRKNAEINAFHMGPPLRDAKLSIDAIGSAELQPGHVRRIKLFIDERLQEIKAHRKRISSSGQKQSAEDEYTIHPSARPPDRIRPHWRFSCSGFVLMAYSEAGIRLISDNAPLLTLDMLKQAYPFAVNRLDDPNFRQKMGLIGTGPWPVILAGYVINSLRREVNEIHSSPYVPVSGDECFAG